MAENLAPIVVDNDIPTKKYVDDEGVWIGPTQPDPPRAIWIDTSVLMEEEG